PPAWVRGVLFFISALAISLAIAYGMKWAGVPIEHPLFIAFILSTTSIGIVTPALKEKAWLLVPFGQEILLYALLADIVTLLLVAAYTTLHTTGNAFSVLLVMFLLLLFVVAYLLLKAIRGAKWFTIVENATSELGLRGSFALILVFLTLAEALGTQVVIGAFLAGAIISLLSERHGELTQKLNSIGYGFFLPLFFVNVGLTFNISSLSAGPMFWISLGIILIGMYANKVIGSLIFMRTFSLRQRFAAGALLGSQLSLTIVASQIGQQIGVLSPSFASGLILLAIITCLISPGVFTRLVGRQTAVLGPSGTGVLPKDFLPDGWMVTQIEVLSPRFSHTPMRRLLLPQEILFISIERGSEKIVPRGHTVLEQFDVVHLMGTPKAVERLRRRFGA
ncbi:MAG: cation:proton antiporter, partial [Firmicutes bacterium]|nr:cation:proton antiporter [Bacillota bacterium]